jgi:very-short-patch-repair endonuclease
VLSGLGWKTMRVSAIDVLRDATKVVDRIDAAARA